nr:MAG TPA: YppF-like protein [Crassvirales sp.]
MEVIEVLKYSHLCQEIPISQYRKLFLPLMV